MDKALDDIIKDKPARGGRRPRGARTGARQQVLGKAPEAPASKVRKASVRPPPAATGHHAEKIMVSGLPIDVNEAQIKELFTTTVGPLREVQLQYNPQGKWTGSAIVLFQRKGDGTKAYEAYNNRLIDGKKPMKIELMFDPAKAAPAASLVSRVAPAPRAAAAAKPAPMEGVQRTGGRPRRGRGGGVRTKRPPKTVADLDAEMEDYSAATNTPAAAAPAGAMAE